MSCAVSPSAGKGESEYLQLRRSKMVFAFISIFLFIILVLIAVKIGFSKDHFYDEPVEKPTIHASGIYSIVRESPRHRTMAVKPTREEILKYLNCQNVDIKGTLLSDEDKKIIVDKWFESVEENIASIENGDIKGIEFYYYDFKPNDCPVCTRYFTKGKFVTREEIYRYPAIVPPLHLGCTCKLLAHHGRENLRETTEMGMLPLFRNQVPPPMPEWKMIIKTVSV